jgi:PKD repeat protein
LKPLYSRSQNLKVTKTELAKLGLTSVQATMIEPNTQGLGLLGIGYLKPLPDVPTDYQAVTNSKGNPVYSKTTVQTYSIFFAQYENTYIPEGDEKLYSFVAVRTLNPITSSDCAKQLGMKQSNVYGLTLSEYEAGTFQHPVYLNQNKEPLTFNNTDIPVMLQTVPGRLDNVPIGAPNFPLTPNRIASQLGMLPQPPYPDFVTSFGQTGGTAISAGGTVGFRDASLMVPTTVQPTAWNWNFGPSASPTGSTAQNPSSVTYGSTGSFSVTLTAYNAYGSKSITKQNFVIVS